MNYKARVSFLSALMVCAIFIFSACNEDENDNQILLTSNLVAPNQNGTNSDFVMDANGLVPSMATGTFEATLDLETNQLQDIKLTVSGMSMSELRPFGPNSTPFHIHLPNSGNQGDFGFNVVDLVFGTNETNFVATMNGFEFTRDFVSILEADQGNYINAGVHPGDDVILERLQNGFPFIIIHSTKAIFTNTSGSLPDGSPAPEGFPFAELRGEVRSN